MGGAEPHEWVRLLEDENKLRSGSYSDAFSSESSVLSQTFSMMENPCVFKSKICFHLAPPL